ncbi:MAG: 2-hydroxychromene-2-carboxylate isomerase [Rugosibacter sp.]
MKKQLEFFFDFMSPFAFLAETQLGALTDKFDLDVRYVPLDLPVAKLAAGNNGPSNRMVPAKLRYLTSDMQRWAKRYNLPPLVFPTNFASERANRGLFYAIDKGQSREYVHNMFQAVWGRGEDMTDEAVLRRVAEELGWSGDAFLAYTLGEDSAQRFAAANKETHERGVFGVPTMFVDGEMWWGNDRLQFVEEYLKTHK